ncbi:outer membrane fibronectin-binding protein [Campylobacter pinnipediorum subsp. caledonicus]|uniref:Outer membrane fibronectin-binding protein n=1 Tax=Campylobacter pinnipediorum subsp. caledonicus TaxID=1874362 RepID=A0A1S6U6B6_9BACT|nr:OmpA family protein [Campylobacter pinnipediorum]AQW87288.1 outer membrane fibronectin-binding protein [Campylobacter pinnipediorum subsp. caledonicus]
MKKIALALVSASAIFAADMAYNYEVTPTVGGVRSEGNLDLTRDQFNIGITAARNLEDMFFDQIQVGMNYTRNIKETIMDSKTKENVTRKGHATRYHADVVKNLIDFSDNVGAYGLVGAGYEDISQKFIANERGGFGEYGLGLRFQVTDNFALKAEAKDAIKFDHGDHNWFYTLGFAIGLDAKNTPAPMVKPEPIVVEQMPIVEPEPVSMDDDNDGVINELDRCPNTPAGVVVDENGCEKVIILRDLDVNFAFDSYKVSVSYAEEIRKVAEFMSENPAYRVLLKGHTDSVGAEAYNQKLSEKRANAVSQALQYFGVDASKIKTVGFGETRPVAPNNTKEGRAENRRVEATFSK